MTGTARTDAGEQAVVVAGGHGTSRSSRNRRRVPSSQDSGRRYIGGRGRTARGVVVRRARLDRVLRPHPGCGRYLADRWPPIRTAAPRLGANTARHRAPAGDRADRDRRRRVRGLLRRRPPRPASPDPQPGDCLRPAVRAPRLATAGTGDHTGQRRRRGGLLPRSRLRRRRHQTPRADVHSLSTHSPRPPPETQRWSWPPA